MTYYAGLMSGTSMDGIDSVLIDDTNRLVSGHTFPYSESTHQLLSNVVKEKKADLSVLGTLHRQVGLEFAKAYNRLLEDSGLSAPQIRAIGFHGQTISHQTWHKPFYSFQIGCPSTLAVETATTVVADFRSMDIALGGQGAPLAPLYHNFCFSNLHDRIAVVNIGGISNLSMFIDEKLVAGYDTGPGNCLLNAWVKENQNLDFDEGGSWAASGVISETLLNNLLKDNYFRQSPPKSTDREYFSLSWLQESINEPLPPEDIQATLLELTAITIADQVNQYAPVKHLVLCGGGVHNIVLNERLSFHLPDTVVSHSSYFGLNENYLEAMMMAWLAKERLDNRAFDLSAITGNPYPTMLGHIYYHPVKFKLV